VRTFFQLALIVPVLAAALGQSARAQGDGVFLVTYVEVMPNAVAPATALLRRHRDASRRDDGNLRFDVLSEIARPNRFVILEAWKDRTALDAHVQSAGSVQFNEQLNPIQDAPTDQRVNHALYLGQGTAMDRPGAIEVVTHVDVIPPGTDACLAALKAMSVDSPKDSGNISYQVLQQANRANHFAVLEEWTDRSAADAHAIAAHTRAFREKLTPIAGALYDERFYTALN
jgi:quinol monooxygenase YgiN